MIKRIKILATGALLLAGLGACSPSGKKTGADSTVDTLRTAETVNLLNNLRKVPTQGIMFGHHDDPLYGVGWEGDEDRSDVKSVCGDYPAVMSFDLGGGTFDVSIFVKKIKRLLIPYLVFSCLIMFSTGFF